MTETKAQTDVDARTEHTVSHLNEVMSWDVVGRDWPCNDHDVIVAHCDVDLSTTNSLAKARVINTVLSEAPALEVYSTEDDKMMVTFKFKNK